MIENLNIWLDTTPSWINLTHGGMLILGGIIAATIIIGIYNKVTTGDSGF